jgi:hypothetical protein
MSGMRQGIAAFCVLAAAASAAPAAIYNDTVGDNFDANAHMDFKSVEVTESGTDITFKITLNDSADIAANNWGKYLIGIDTSDATGDVGAPVGNPWGRNLRMADGMDAFIGSWVDGGGGFQPWTFAAGSWTQNGTGTPTLGTNTTTITTSLASLGLTAGQTFEFDVYSTGGNGGDSANDAAANPGQSTTTWGGPYTTASNSGFTYPAAVPEPASVGLLGVAGLAVLGRRRSRRA